MAAKKTIEWFRERSDDSYRDEAKNILDSYAHPWDILVELAQNSVDALEQRAAKDTGSFRGRIDIDVQPGSRSVIWFDNGIGISERDLDSVLAPHFSKKRGKQLRGEKGVGLTYIALMGNSLEICTKTEGMDKPRRLVVHGSRDWLQGSGPQPKIEIDDSEHDPFPKERSYTLVNVSSIPEYVAEEEGTDIFALGRDQLVHLLRTRTAIGFTGHLFNIPPRVDIDASICIDNEPRHKIQATYASPREHLDDKAVIELGKVREYLAEDDRKRASGRPIWFQRTFQSKTGKDVRAFCFVASRNLYTELSTKLCIVNDDIRVQGGLYVATRGMPTGIALPPPKTGKAAYWPNVFILLEYDSVTLDLGRKSITAPRTLEMLRDQAAKVFSEIDRYIRYAVRDEEGTLDSLMSQDELQDELHLVKNQSSASYREKITCKPSLTYPFVREPKQEQDVIALFCMALARGLFPYEILRVSSSYRYDCFLQLRIKDQKPTSIVCEFKYRGESIVKDLQDSKARYGQLHLLICWDLDEKPLLQHGFHVKKLRDAKKDLPGATHRIDFPIGSGVKDMPIAVICLRDHLQVTES